MTGLWPNLGRVPRCAQTAALLLVAGVLAGCGGGDDNRTGVDRQDFSDRVDHPLFPLGSPHTWTLTGTEGGHDVSVTYKVDGPAGIHDVPARKLQVVKRVGGKEVDDAWEYYSQRSDGSVWMLGRQQRDTFAGWLAGERGAKAVQVMRARPAIGDQLEVDIPKVSRSRSTVVEVGVSITTRGGNFTDCVKTSDYDVREKTSGFSWYCPGVGLTRTESPSSMLEL
jgi:hypothetical protein